MEKGKKNIISGHSRGLVPVPYVFWLTGTGTEKSVPVPNVLFWTTISVLAITWSFLIRFE